MDAPTIVLAAAAGVASFLSPCMLPVIPAFVAQLVGTSLGYEEVRRRDVFSSVAVFVLGFSVVFAALGVLLNAVLADASEEVAVWLSRVAGAVVILLGLHLAGLVRLPFLEREYKLGTRAGGRGHLASLLFGASFAVAWTPCVGPILGSTLLLAASRPASAFPLLLAYAVGLGLPFLVVGLVPSRAFALIKGHRRLAARLHTTFGVVLVAMGVLVFTNELSLLVNFPVLKEVLI